MRFRFNVMVNGFVLVSVAVQSATAEALAHADILNTQGEKIDEADIASTDQGFNVALKVLNLSPREHGIHIQNNDVGILNFVADGVTLGDGANSIFNERGASLLVHAKPDNLMSDSSGNCGDRIAC